MNLMQVNKLNKNDSNLVSLSNFRSCAKNLMEDHSSPKSSHKDLITEKQISSNTSNSVPNCDHNLLVQNGECSVGAIDIIFKLWERTSHTTSNGMAVGQLELLYDSIAACISVHKYDFEELIQVNGEQCE